jgi:Ca-activated chloride channel family protein
MKTTLKFAKKVFQPGAGIPVDLVVEVKAPEAEPLERLPLDVALVIDRSGSMSGAPLENVKTAVIGLLRHLGPDDRIAVVAFDRDVEVILPLAQQDLPLAERAINRLQTRGNTNLSGGWLEGLRLLATSQREGALRRIITLTDGHANEGVVDPSRIAELVRGGRSQGVTSSFIGFDDGYDEVLLSTIADAGGGNDYWCDGPDKAAEVFLAEFGALSSVVAQNLSVTVTPTAAVSDLGLVNDIAVVIGESSEITAHLGDAYGAETRRLVLRFHLQPDLVEGDTPIAVVQVSWAAVGSTPALHNSTVTAQVRIDRDPNAIDPEADSTVVEEVLLLEAAQAQREAGKAADQGDYSQASRLLLGSADKLEKSGRDPRKVAELRLRAARIAEGHWSGRESKRAYSQARSANRSRTTDFADENRDETPE